MMQWWMDVAVQWPTYQSKETFHFVNNLISIKILN